MIRAAVLDADIDLRGLLGAIAEHGIRFRVNEESGSQVIWVATQADADKVTQALKRWQELREQGLLTEQDLPRSGSLGAYFPVLKMFSGVIGAFLQAPVTMLLILGALVVAAVSSLGSELQPVSGLFYPTFTITQGGALAGFWQIIAQISSLEELLRTLTPALLHFGALHLVFNSVWIWHFGRMIERSQSSLLFLGVVVFIAFISNATQYLWSLTANFGGLSGVVYGLLGYIWMWQLLMPFGRLRLPPAMIGFLLVALVVMELLAGSWIASAAHTGGLFAGIMAGLLSAGIYKIRHRV
jgi:GlpG protein